MTMQVGRVVRQLRDKLQTDHASALRDAELLGCFIGDRAEKAFAMLVERHGPMILGVCRRVLRNPHDAEDAFQATFLVLARQAARVRKPDSLASWLHGIALRLALNMKREAGKRRQREKHASPPSPIVPADLCGRELHAALDEELARLPENQRQPLLLCYLEGHTQEQAAHQLGWPRGTLKRRLERGRELLKARLTQRGLTLGAALVSGLAGSEALAIPLPASLASATIHAAGALACGQAAGSIVSARALALADGAIKAMYLAKLGKLTLVVLLAVVGCGLGSVGYFGITTGQTETPQAASDGNDPSLQQTTGEGERVASAGEKSAQDGGTDTTRRFQALAAELAIFQTGEFAYGRADRSDTMSRFIPKKMSEPWLKVHAALVAGKDNVADLKALLKHNDPRVRTLALAALFERQDPLLLPDMAALMPDKMQTAPEVEVRRAVSGFGKEDELLPEDIHQQTVGHVAEVLLNWWLAPAGYKVMEFDRYWADRKDRTFCANWFLARLYRAGQASSHFDKSRAPLIRAIRKEVDALPAVDRDWTLLWLAAHHLQASSAEPAHIFATPQDLLEAGKRLGPDRLMDLIQEKEISADPDLAAKSPPEKRRTRGRDDLIGWVLRNAGKLLRPEDAATILAMEPKLRDRSPWCAIAAADLQPANARAWLRAALARFDGEPVYTHLAYHRAEIAAALWRIVGESEMDYLVDRFYQEKVASNPHSTQTGLFLEHIKGVRAPADRRLVARLVTDPRLDKLDYQSLQGLTTVVNGWTKQPVVNDADLRPMWERGTWGPETAADFKVLGQWRSKLRDSVKQWNLSRP